jgi:hypothetical protein
METALGQPHWRIIGMDLATFRRKIRFSQKLGGAKS